MSLILSTNASAYDNERTICATLSDADLVELLEAARFAHSSYANEHGMFPAQVQPISVLRLAVTDEQAARAGNPDDILGLDGYVKRMADRVELDMWQDIMWAS